MSRRVRRAAPQEAIHLSVREHGAVLAAPFTAAALGVTGFALAARAALSGAVPLALRAPVVTLAGLLTALVLVRLVTAVAGWHGRRLVVTDRTALLLSGAIRRRTRALPLELIEEVEIDCGGLGRVLHYGGVVVCVRGRREHMFGLRRLPDPDLLFGLLLGLAADAPPPSRTPPARPVPVVAGRAWTGSRA